MINPRDIDLVYPDHHLTDTALDDLWNWYIANRETLDPTIVFVKLVNSTRKPYKTHIKAQKSAAGAVQRWASSSASCETPSESSTVLVSNADGDGDGVEGGSGGSLRECENIVSGAMKESQKAINWNVGMTRSKILMAINKSQADTVHKIEKMFGGHKEEIEKIVLEGQKGMEATVEQEFQNLKDQGDTLQKLMEEGQAAVSGSLQTMDKKFEESCGITSKQLLAQGALMRKINDSMADFSNHSSRHLEVVHEKFEDICLQLEAMNEEKNQGETVSEGSVDHKQLQTAYNAMQNINSTFQGILHQYEMTTKRMEDQEVERKKSSLNNSSATSKDTTSVTPLPPARIAISPQGLSPLIPKFISSNTPSTSLYLDSKLSISKCETYYLRSHADGSFSIECVANPNTYLHICESAEGGKWYLCWKPGMDMHTKFSLKSARIAERSENFAAPIYKFLGLVHIESILYPGCFLSQVDRSLTGGAVGVFSKIYGEISAFELFGLIYILPDAELE